MHLGNGAITPECGVVALGIAVAGAGIALAAERGLGLSRSKATTAGALGAAVFAAQLFNVQVFPYSSVHLVGGVLLAWLLSPALAVLTMAAILAIQALLLGDGGLLALGANIVNMGLLPAVGVIVLRRTLGNDANPVRIAALLGLTACLCTVAGAALIVIEVSVGRTAVQLQGLDEFAGRMLAMHLLAGMLEAGATVAIVAALAGLRKTETTSWHLSAPGAAALAAVSLMVALISLPSWGISSDAPDGYEWAIGAAGGTLAQTLNVVAGVNDTVQSWQDSIGTMFAGTESVVLLLATVLAGVAAWSWARLCSIGLRENC